MRYLLIGWMWVMTTALLAQNSTLSGYVRDAATGETLIGANVVVVDDERLGTTSNLYGFYSLTLPANTYDLRVTYLGYADQRLRVDLSASCTLNIELTEGVTMETVVVTAEVVSSTPTP